MIMVELNRRVNTVQQNEVVLSMLRGRMLLFFDDSTKKSSKEKCNEHQTSTKHNRTTEERQRTHLRMKNHQINSPNHDTMICQKSLDWSDKAADGNLICFSIALLNTVIVTATTNAMRKHQALPTPGQITCSQNLLYSQRLDSVRFINS